MKTAIFSARFYEKEFLSKLNTDQHELVYFEESLNSSTLHLAEGFKAVSILMHDHINQEISKTLADAGIKVILLRCAGYDNVNLDALAEQRIKVFHVPAYSPQAVAEHATALILALSRKTHQTYARTRNNNFSLEHLMGFNLFEKTVGVVGAGRIGSAFCNIMLGFGCKVIAFDPFPSETLRAKGVVYMTFDEMLQRSDIISVHCPLYSETYRMFNKMALAKVKKGAMLINTSRGSVLDTLEVIDALKSGQLGALGIDVYEWEENLFFRDLSNEIVKDDFMALLLSYPNVLVTPHQAFFTKEAVTEICRTTLQNLSDFENCIASGNELVPAAKVLKT